MLGNDDHPVLHPGPETPSRYQQPRLRTPLPCPSPAPFPPFHLAQAAQPFASAPIPPLPTVDGQAIREVVLISSSSDEEKAFVQQVACPGVRRLWVFGSWVSHVNEHEPALNFFPNMIYPLLLLVCPFEEQVCCLGSNVGQIPHASKNIEKPNNPSHNRPREECFDDDEDEGHTRYNRFNWRVGGHHAARLIQIISLVSSSGTKKPTMHNIVAKATEEG